MAAIIFTASTAGDVALVSGAAKTVLNIAAPANQRLRILAWGVYFNGTSAAAVPARVSLTRQEDAGTGTGVTPKAEDGDLSISSNTTSKENMSVEPASGNVLKTVLVHPQYGYEIAETPGREVIVGIGGFLGILITAPAAVSCRAWIKLEE